MGFLDALFRPKDQSDEEAERSAQVMQRLKSRHSSETGKWLALMQDPNQPEPPKGPSPRLDSLDKREILNEAPYVPPIEAQYKSLAHTGKHAASQTPSSQTQSDDNATVDWVNMLFTEFDRQSKAYNASAEGTQLVMTVHRPTFTFETVQKVGVYDPQRRINVFKGHVTTQYWSMLVQGCESKIDVYIISADEILNFTINDIRQSQVSPFFTIMSQNVGDRRVWYFGETAISPQTIPLLAKELLGDLIRVATGTMSDSELFSDQQVDLKLGDTVAKGFSLEKAAQQAGLASPMVSPQKTPEGGHPLQPAEQTPQEMINDLVSWKACDVLVEAINKDLPAIVSREGSLDPEKDKETIDKLRSIATALRSLSGQVSGVVAEHRPSKGKKYNPS